MKRSNDGFDFAHLVWPLIFLWLCGNALRLTILAVPPVLPLIHSDLHLNATQIGILNGLPSLLLALAAVPGSLLIARLGIPTALVGGLILTAVGGALRGGVFNLWWLYGMTFVMCSGVAIMQVTMPPAVRAWLPDKIGFATAVYTNGLIIGEILPPALMYPAVLPLVHGSWQWGFVFWGAPVGVLALVAVAFMPRQSAPTKVAAKPARWWPNWGDPLIWRLGFMLGAVNATYFGTNAFLPGYLNSNGQEAWIGAALSGLNAGQLPASFLLLLIANRIERSPLPFFICGALFLVATAGIVFGSGPWVVAAATLVGFSCAMILVLMLAMPPLLSAPDDVHRVTAAMFTISYSFGVIVPVLSGAAWDATGHASFAFIPIGACGLLLAGLAPTIRRLR